MKRNKAGLARGRFSLRQIKDGITLFKRKGRLYKLCSCKHCHETLGNACDTISSARIKVILTTTVNPLDVTIRFDNTRTGCSQGIWPVEYAAKAQGTFLCLRNTVVRRAHNYGAASNLRTCISIPPPSQPVLFLQRKKLSSFVRTHFLKRPADENASFRSRKLKSTRVTDSKK